MLALISLGLAVHVPSLLSIPMLRLDPRWAPLRAHPRFDELVRRFGQDG